MFRLLNKPSGGTFWSELCYSSIQQTYFNIICPSSKKILLFLLIVQLNALIAPLTNGAIVRIFVGAIWLNPYGARGI
jgi:hypothetical protein